MAAKMNLCRCLSGIVNIFLFICFFYLNHSAVVVNSASTQPATSVTTEASTTTPATTEAQTTTPTPPPVTTIAPNQPQSSIGQTAIGQCLCDLTGNQCDINCCCDTDCTEADYTVFTCDPAKVTVDNKKCYQEELFLFTNSPATTKTENGLFCIYYDNNNERNFYLDPNFIEDFVTFNDYIDKYAEPSLQRAETYELPTFTFDSYYRTGDPVYTVYPNNATGYMSLPTGLGSTTCNYQNPLAYLTEATSVCTNDVTQLNAQCVPGGSLSADAYYNNFKVVTLPGLFGYVENGTLIEITTVPPVPTQAPVTTQAATTDAGTATTAATTAAVTNPAPTSAVNPNLVQTLYNNPYTISIAAGSLQHLCRQTSGLLAPCTFTVPPNASYDATTQTCQNVVLEARYVVTTNGTSGISKMEVHFVFGDVTQTSLTNAPITQGFSVAYNSLADNNITIPKSGNPGYVIGKPLLYGQLNVSSTPDGVKTQTIIRATDPTLGLTVVRAGADGQCAAYRVPLRFGENMRSGCTIRLNLTTISTATCRNIQQAIVDTLEGPNTPDFDSRNDIWVDNNKYVGTFGNTAVNKVGDWVKVIVSGRPKPSEVTASTGFDACKLKMGMHIQVLYANVGALANPQPKILGVALLYDKVKDVKYRCVGAFCQDDTSTLSQSFEVSHTVSFVDVSQPAVKYAGEAPVFIARVPSDFFYPFLYYSSGGPGLCSGDGRLSVIVTSMVVIYSQLQRYL